MSVSTLTQHVAKFVAMAPAERETFLSSLATRLDEAIVSVSTATDDEARAAATATIKRVFEIRSAVGDSLNKPVKTPVDPFMVVAQRIANLRLAADLLSQGYVSPDGLEGTLDEQATHPFGQSLPYAAGNLDAALKLAGGKLTRATSGGTSVPSAPSVEGGIQGVIDAAFANHPSGTYLTSAEIGKQGGHPRGSGANGAINARLYPRNGSATKATGVTPNTDPSRSQGAVKN